MALSLLDVQTSIAGGSIASVKTIYTSANAPVEVFNNMCPCMLPDPFKPVESSVSLKQTWMGASGAGHKRTRVYNYVVLIAESGTGRRPAESASTLSFVLDATDNYLCDWNASAAIATGPVTITAAGQLTDATGKPFVGFTVAFTVVSQY